MHESRNSNCILGLKCPACPIYQAAVTNDDVLRVELANEFSSDTCKIEKDDINCYGC